MFHQIQKHKKSYKNILFILILLSIHSILNAQSWQAIGPGPLHNGQSEGISNRPVIGAIQGFATHPSDDDIIYAASVNGGIWKTSNATAASPNWTALTDDQVSLSMTDIEFDVADATHQTLIASFGRSSSLGRLGGERAGLIRTTDGGSNWTLIDNGMAGRNISSVQVNGAVILAAVDVADNFSCANIGLFRSTDTGDNWAKTGPVGSVNALIADPHTSGVYYLGVDTFNGACAPASNSGVYKSIDSGATWTKVNDAAIETVIGSNNCHFEISVGPNSNTVYSAMACNGQLSGVFRSDDATSTWTAMDIPTTVENSGTQGIHPGGQGGLHFSMTADPANSNLVYIGGDRQPDGLPGAQFPNSIGANDYSGRLFRGDASLGTGSQWTPLTHSGTASNSAPHADSRELRFDSNGSLLESDDGGIFRRLSHTDNTGDWMSVNGDLMINEQHDTAYDSTSSIAISGNQDNGTSKQNMFASTTWDNIGSGDGGDVVVDTLSLSGSNQSLRYISSQNMGGLRRLIYDQNNVYQGLSFLNLTVLNGGADVDPQFVTPLAINNLNGNRLIIGAENSVYESLDNGDTIT
jgi:hypothetical protein